MDKTKFNKDIVFKKKLKCPEINSTLDLAYDDTGEKSTGAFRWVSFLIEFRIFVHNIKTISFSKDLGKSAPRAYEVCMHIGGISSCNKILTRKTFA